MKLSAQQLLDAFGEPDGAKIPSLPNVAQLGTNNQANNIATVAGENLNRQNEYALNSDTSLPSAPASANWFTGLFQPGGAFGKAPEYDPQRMYGGISSEDLRSYYKGSQLLDDKKGTGYLDNTYPGMYERWASELSGMDVKELEDIQASLATKQTEFMDNNVVDDRLATLSNYQDVVDERLGIVYQENLDKINTYYPDRPEMVQHWTDKIATLKEGQEVLPSELQIMSSKDYGEQLSEFKVDLPPPKTAKDVSTQTNDLQNWFIENAIEIRTEGNSQVFTDAKGGELTPQLKATAPIYYSIMTKGQSYLQDQLGKITDPSSSMAVAKFTQGEMNKRTAIAEERLREQNNFEVAIAEGNLSESIRSNRAAERLRSDQLELDRRKMKIDFMMTFASNPAILFSLKKMGMFDDIAKMIGIEPSKFLTDIEGDTDPFLTHNIQSFSRLSPEEKRDVIFAIQARTGMSKEEILQKLTRGAPTAAPTGGSRRTLG